MRDDRKSRFRPRVASQLGRADGLARELVRRSGRAKSELGELRAVLECLTEAQEHAVLDVLMSALCQREGVSVSHSHRAARYAARLGEACGLGDEEIALIELGAMLHDVGKLAISDRILGKPGALSVEEWAEMRRHPAFGDDLLSLLPGFESARPIVLQHHERWDGAGYPNGLRGHQIHLGARICAVADTLDAMTTRRAYRPALPFEDAWDEILSCRSSQFDPRVVDGFQHVGPDEWAGVVRELQSDADPLDWPTAVASLA